MDTRVQLGKAPEDGACAFEVSHSQGGNNNRDGWSCLPAGDKLFGFFAQDPTVKGGGNWRWLGALTGELRPTSPSVLDTGSSLVRPTLKSRGRGRRIAHEVVKSTVIKRVSRFGSSRVNNEYTHVHALVIPWNHCFGLGWRESGAR